MTDEPSAGAGAEWSIELTHDVAGTLSVDYRPVTVDQRTSISIGDIMDMPAREGWERLKDVMAQVCARIRLNGDEIEPGGVPDFWGLAVVLMHPSFRRRPTATPTP